MAPKEFSIVYKEFNQLKLEKFRPTSNQPVEKARQYNLYIQHIDAVFDTLEITDEPQRVKLLTLHEFELVRKAKAAVPDTQVAAIAGEYKKLQGKLDIYLETKKLKDSARKKLSEIKQKEGQSAADVLILIEELFEEAGWATASNKDEQVQSILINALRSEEVKRQWRYSNMAGRTPLTTPGLVELANQQAEEKRTYSAEEVVRAVKKFGNYKNQKFQQQQRQQHKCDGCGSFSHKYKSPACPAKDAKCNDCKYKGHFSSECRLKKSRQFKPQQQKKQGKKWNKKKWHQKSKKISEDTSESATASNPGASADSVLEQLLEQTLSFH